MADKEKKVAPGSEVDKATTEESKAAEKVAKAAKGSKNKKPNFFVRSGKGIKKFFKDFKGECKKIDWPNAQTILKSTGVVLLVVAIVSLFVFALDFGLKEGIEQLKVIASGEVVTDGNVTDGNAEAHDHDHDHAAESGEAEVEGADEETTKSEETTKADESTTAQAEDTTAAEAE